MKKNNSIYVVLLLLCTIQGYSQILKKDVENYLIEKKILDSTEISQNAHLIDLNKNVLDDKVIYYDLTFPKWHKKSKVRVAVIDGNIYAFPEDYNLLTKFLSKKNTSTEKYVMDLIYIMLNQNDIIESHSTIDTTIEGTNYKYEVVTWQKINGVRSHWYFSFKGNKINIISEVILEVFVGDYEFVNEGISGGGRVIYYNLITYNEGKDPKSNSVAIRNWESDFITYSGNNDFESANVIVVDNNNATPTEERNIEIWLIDFGYEEQVDVVISINYVLGTPFEIYNETLTTDDLYGNAIVTWTVPSDILHTGEYKIKAGIQTGMSLLCFLTFLLKSGKSSILLTSLKT